MYTIDELKNKLFLIYGDKYTYNWDTYKKVTEDMEICCPKHGIFYKSLHLHINKKQGCPKCGRENKIKNKRFKNKKRTKNDFFKECKEKFNDKFLYDLESYRGMGYDISYYCPIHGKTTQNASSHLNSKYGCPKCAKEYNIKNNTNTTEEFIKKAKEVHGNKYDYSNTEYVNSKKPVTIICPIHGEFKQTPFNHLSGNGCPECGKEKTIESNYLTNEEFVDRAKLIHKNKYIYNDRYVSYRTKINIVCPIHGNFSQTPDNHLQGKGCPKCGNSISNAENEIAEFCASILGEEKIIHRDRSVLKNRELDIYIPSKQMAIEYNGLIWHSDKFGKDKHYHLSKTEECKKLGIKLIQIFEDEYVNHKEIVLNKIAHIIGEQKKLPKIMARKCEIKEIKRDISKEFLDKYHIQGSGQGKVHLGAFYEGKIIAVMSFKEETNGSNKWELTRFASDYHYVCQGVGGKLFKYFIINYIPIEIKSFADRRWTVDEEHNIYIQLGFKFEYYTKPEYRYIDGIKCERHHKFGFRKDALMKKYGDKYDLNIGMTETEMTEKIGFHKIWDCGLIKYVWKQK